MVWNIITSVVLIATILFSTAFGVTPSLFQVSKVFDGDTILLDDGTTVRLIGVDTPELHHPLKPVQYFADEAYKFSKSMIEGKNVKLEYDWQKIDKYGRTLAYAYLLDGTFVNAEIIKQGYGFAYAKYPFKYIDDFRKYEREARKKKLGLWDGDGKTELNWLLKKKTTPIVLFPMAGNFWTVKYKDFYTLKVSTEALSEILDFIKYKSCELIGEDLQKELLQKGWIKLK